MMIESIMVMMLVVVLMVVLFFVTTGGMRSQVDGLKSNIEAMGSGKDTVEQTHSLKDVASETVKASNSNDIHNSFEGLGKVLGQIGIVVLIIVILLLVAYIVFKIIHYRKENIFYKLLMENWMNLSKKIEYLKEHDEKTSGDVEKLANTLNLIKNELHKQHQTFFASILTFSFSERKNALESILKQITSLNQSISDYGQKKVQNIK